MRRSDLRVGVDVVIREKTRATIRKLVGRDEWLVMTVDGELLAVHGRDMVAVPCEEVKEIADDLTALAEEPDAEANEEATGDADQPAEATREEENSAAAAEHGRAAAEEMLGE